MSAGNLGESVLLPLWLPIPRLHHPGGVLLTNQHRHGVLSAVCRGKGHGARSWGGEPGSNIEWVTEAVWVSHVPPSGHEVSGRYITSSLWASIYSVGSFISSSGCFPNVTRIAVGPDPECRCND